MCKRGSTDVVQEPFIENLIFRLTMKVVILIEET